MPMRLVTGALSVPWVERLVAIPPEIMEYFDHRTLYPSTNTQRDLSGSGISCPSFASYVGVLVDFVRTHPDIAVGPMT
jgi:hypothetical protein